MAKAITSARSGIELPPEESLPVLVGGGVNTWTGVAVSPWNDWNGVLEGSVGVAVSPWNDWNGVGVGFRVGVGVGSVWGSEWV